MSAYLNRLYDEYRRAAKIGKDLMDLAARDNRDLRPEEAEQVDRAYADVNRLKVDIDKVRTFEDLQKAHDIFRDQAAPAVECAGGRSNRSDLRSLFDRVQDNPGGVAIGSTPRADIYSLDLRALQSAGGTAIETSFADFLTVYERTFTPMLSGSVVTILNREDGSPLVLPRVTADPNHGGTVTAEAAGILEADATVSSITLNPFKYALTNLWSAELGQDSAIPLEETVAFTTARELALDIGSHLTTGDGSAKPNGFITAATNGGTATGTAAAYIHQGPTDLVDLFYGRAAPYRDRGSWQMNATTLAGVRKYRTTDGIFLWQPALTAGEPETILGRPVYENPAMANGSAAKAVAFGDFSRYFVARVVPVRVQASIHYKFNTDQIALRTIERIDGDLVDTDAVAYLVNAAA